MNQVPLYSTDRDLISHSVAVLGTFPARKSVVTFDYPDCTRSYDGDHWTVEAKPLASGLYSTVTGQPIVL